MRMGKWVFLGGFLGLLFLLSPARAQMTLDTESRLRTLEQELQNLRGEQEEMQKEALAAGETAPVIGWRPGRGLNIRGADRSYEFNLGWVTQVHTSFFPDAANLPTGQGSTRLRRLRTFFSFKWDDGLYETGAIITYEALPTVRFLGGGARINFNKFSPYYPRLNLLGVQAMSNPRGTGLSSSSGLALDRDIMVGSILTSGSAKGYGLQWQDVPLGPGKIDNFELSINTGGQFSSKTASDPIDRKGWAAGVTYMPFSEVKGSVLQGLDVGFAYFLAPVDRDEGLPRLPISTLSRNNSVTIWNIETNGDWIWWAPNMGYRYGPYRFEGSYEHFEVERKFASTSCCSASGDLGDTEVNGIVLRNGWFFWGDERGGLRLSHTFNRVDFDNGSGFLVRNRFSGMRRYHVIANSALLRWFQKPNVIWSLNFDHYDFNKMAGGGDAPAARTGLAIGPGGGDYNEIIFAFHFGF